MMRSRTLTTALIWLAALALAAQGFGATALLGACQCLACACGEQAQKMSCCETDATQTQKTGCGQVCCQNTSSDCTQASRIPGSCCCVGAEPNVPVNLPKGDNTSPEKPLAQVAFAVETAAAPTATSSVILLTDVRHNSPPPRILYCVWRI